MLDLESKVQQQPEFYVGIRFAPGDVCQVLATQLLG
jgi:hypothetical protein